MKKRRLAMSVLSLALAASVVFPSFASAEYNNFSPVTVIGEKEATSGFKVNPAMDILNYGLKIKVKVKY